MIKQLSLTSPIRFDGRQLGACKRALCWMFLIRGCFSLEIRCEEADDGRSSPTRNEMAKGGTNLVKVKSIHLRFFSLEVSQNFRMSLSDAPIENSCSKYEI